MTNKPDDYLIRLAARVKSVANDLKRTPAALADELGMSQEEIDRVLAGKAGDKEAHALIRKMVKAYPISEKELIVEMDDTDSGVFIMRARESKATSRMFERPDRNGAPSPYYEYRDTAMVRGGPYKPEWIQPLRVVADNDPDNPGVAYNNGHLLHQMTFFIGEVNFYWKLDGKTHCAEMNTGDSNYITPFVPHSFTSRNADTLGLIIAVTYGSAVHRNLDAFADLDEGAIRHWVGDPRDPKSAYGATLARYRNCESLSAKQLSDRLTALGIDQDRAAALASGAEMAGGPELESLAASLRVFPKDLMIDQLYPEAEVVISRHQNGGARHYPDSNQPVYMLSELARSPHQPELRGFEMKVLATRNEGAEIKHHLHEYVFNYGRDRVEICWGGDSHSFLAPGDSAYVRPSVGHRFWCETGNGRLAAARVPGGLNDESLREFSTYAPDGRDRVIMENRQWF